MQQQEEKLLTSQEAISVFTKAGLSEPTFRRRILAGHIVPASKKRGGAKYPEFQVYAAAGVNFVPEDTVDKPVVIKQRRKHRIKTKLNIEPAHFEKAIVDDMPEIAEVINAIFDVKPDIEHWQRWIYHNPDMAYVLRATNRVVGFALAMPYVHEQKIISILSNEVGPNTYPEDLAQYAPGVKTCLYIRSVGVLPGVSKTQKRIWGALLVRGLQSVIAEIGNKGVQIEKIYSRSETIDGINILRHLGFTEIVSHTSYRNFMIDIPISGLNMILKYKEAFIDWQKRHSGDAA